MQPLPVLLIVLYRYRTGSRHKLVTAAPVKKHRAGSRSNTPVHVRIIGHSERASEPAARHPQARARAQPNRYHVHSLVSNTGTCTIIGHSERPLRCSHAREATGGCHTSPSLNILMPHTPDIHQSPRTTASATSRSCSRSRTESVRAAARRHGSTTIMMMCPQSVHKGHVCPSCLAQARPRAL